MKLSIELLTISLSHLQAINTAYPTGLEGFVKDNAVALDQNKAFKQYADANTIKLLDEAIEASKEKVDNPFMYLTIHSTTKTAE